MGMALLSASRQRLSPWDSLLCISGHAKRAILPAGVDDAEATAFLLTFILFVLSDFRKFARFVRKLC
jgi:hypothetical protein